MPKNHAPTNMASVISVSASSRLETDLENGGSEVPYALLMAMAAVPKQDKTITGVMRLDSIGARR
jgi:hypothetical protein